MFGYCKGRVQLLIIQCIISCAEDLLSVHCKVPFLSSSPLPLTLTTAVTERLINYAHRYRQLLQLKHFLSAKSFCYERTRLRILFKLPSCSS
jgi:hypothetical protein